MNKTIITLDSSQIDTFGKCNLLWAYLYKENLRLTGLQTTAMDKGTLVHLILEYYYKSKVLNPYKGDLVLANEAIDKFKATPEIYEYGFDKATINFICDRFMKYVFFWRGRDFKVALNNEIPGVELGFSKVIYEEKNLIFILEGKIDLVIEVAPGIYAFVDHKSQDRESHLFGYKPQFLTYAFATGYNYGMINYFGLQKEMTEKSFRRDSIKFPNWMLTYWKRHILGIFWEIYNIETRNTFKETNENLYERNHSNCAGAFDANPCMFNQLCFTESDEMRENIKGFKYTKVESWKPWKVTENSL